MAPSHRPVCKGGFTVLELLLALALATTFLTAFFVVYQAMLKSLNVVTLNERGHLEAGETLLRVVRDIEGAQSINTGASVRLSTLVLNTVNPVLNAPFTNSTRTITYTATPMDNLGLLLAGGTQPSRDVMLHRKEVDGAGNVTDENLGPRHMIANNNPYGATLTDFLPLITLPPIVGVEGCVDPASTLLANAPAPMFKWRADGFVVYVQLILQPTQDMPPYYMRAVATLHGH